MIGKPIQGNCYNHICKFPSEFLYIYHKIENHFEVVLSTLIPNNNNMNNKSDNIKSQM